MKCDGCIFAKWRMTTNGRLHPSKTGRCVFFEKHPINTKLPASFYWHSNPNPSGGYIERGKDLIKAGTKVDCAMKTEGDFR